MYLTGILYQQVCDSVSLLLNCYFESAEKYTLAEQIIGFVLLAILCIFFIFFPLTKHTETEHSIYYIPSWLLLYPWFQSLHTLIKFKIEIKWPFWQLLIMLLGHFPVEPFWKILWCSHENCVYKVFVDDSEKSQETKAHLVWQQTAVEKCCVLFKQSNSFRYCHITDFI